MRFIAATWLLLTSTNGFNMPSIMPRNALRSNENTFLYSTEVSLSEMEDDIERKLDAAEKLESLQHTFRAPSKNQQSSQTFETQEKTFEAEDNEARERQRTIKKILDEDDAKWKEERKKKILGKYADAKDDSEVKRIREEEDRKIEEENAKKASVAQTSGVSLEILEKEFVPEEESNFKPSNVKGKSGQSWFDGDAEIDENLLGEEGPRVVNGKLIDRKEQQGVRVGSAGGWTLEVFPSDFVVHRKYGIGRFDKAILKPKKKLTEEEKEARAIRRNEIVKGMIKDRQNSTAIEQVVANFGTDKDEDPISNPQQTVLEVSYSDAKVHIPVDKAYRLSRYRAGDAVVKPRLSRVKGEAWNKAKRKVEEDTIQMAQDVLALYATRETLSRTPFDPSKEGMYSI